MILIGNLLIYFSRIIILIHNSYYILYGIASIGITRNRFANHNRSLIGPFLKECLPFYVQIIISSRVSFRYFSPTKNSTWPASNRRRLYNIRSLTIHFVRTLYFTLFMSLARYYPTPSLFLEATCSFSNVRP
jgi:hypothetical protein